MEKQHIGSYKHRNDNVISKMLLK